MNINIPLMQKLTTPTWTTERTQPLEIPSFQGPSTTASPERPTGIATPFVRNDILSTQASVSAKPFSDLAVKGGESSTPTPDFQSQNSANSQWLQRVANYMNPKKPLMPLSLGYIYARSSQPMRANGNVVTSGLNWGRDAQITSQMQNFQGGQNAADRALAKQMQEQNMQQQQTLQNRNFDFQTHMQQSSQDFAASMQQRNFDFQHIMQGGQFQHENEMQQRGIANQQQMQSSAQAFTSSMSDKTFNQNKTLTGMNIAGNLANTALGGAVGVAGNIVSKGMDMYMQQQNFHNQQSLMSQNFNQQIQASGSRASSLKLTTD